MPKMTFEQWKVQVNECLLEILDMDCDEVPDVNYRGYYDLGYSPVKVARLILVKLRKGEI